jgi:hypothetical protein
VRPDGCRIGTMTRGALGRPFSVRMFSRYAGRDRLAKEVAAMARNGNLASSASITERILAIRERWHTKRHPFFLAFGEGKLPLKALGRHQALHYHFVSRALASFGLLYARGYHFEGTMPPMSNTAAARSSCAAGISTRRSSRRVPSRWLRKFASCAGLRFLSCTGRRCWRKRRSSPRVSTGEPRLGPQRNASRQARAAASRIAPVSMR